MCYHHGCIIYLDTRFQDGAYSIHWNCSPGAYGKKVSSFQVYFRGMWPTDMRSSVSPIMPLAQPAYENAQSHRGDVSQEKKECL